MYFVSLLRRELAPALELIVFVAFIESRSGRLLCFCRPAGCSRGLCAFVFFRLRFLSFFYVLFIFYASLPSPSTDCTFIVGLYVLYMSGIFSLHIIHVS